ncbi:MAG: DNA-3-methyladenine glycosylase [Candidatus Syntrophonatronum acetioxidans]|uniref:Putative 3-methyladenine DNA glycosylase n=1 Tax=Candidatus Syntrophonatronum acetioxidans TaxID=1795816 RepID=A0A424YGX9_9FIRM|nr:MAG: DNA-3-methyladenine glycosylase [Candidatus Syntrophonatronum acetioxidans]
MKELSRDFFREDTREVAQSLLGKIMVRHLPEGTAVCKIVETEAYLSHNDPACHASRGKTKRNEMMFGPPGRAYVYFIYGMYYCFNVVTGEEGQGEAVLVRALEPIKGIGLMKERRGVKDIFNLTSGPGKLCQALGIDKGMNGKDLLKGDLFIVDGGERPKIETSPRVGIRVAIDRHFRYYISGNPYISGISRSKIKEIMEGKEASRL